MTFRATAKAGLLAAAATMTVTLASPAVASADAVDDILNRIPAGQISCAQAESYWTNAADYRNKRTQALGVAAVHPRGGEIRDAIGRMDNAVQRCGLNGKVGTGDGTVRPAPGNTNQPTRPAPSKQQQPNASRLPVVDLSIPGQPSTTVPFFNAALVKLPDAQKIANNALASSPLAGTPLAQLSSR